MDDSKIKRTYDMDDVKNSNRMDLDNYGEKMDPKKGIKEKNSINDSIVFFTICDFSAD